MKNILPKETRDRTHPLKVYVTDRSRARIKANADGAGLTVSSFLECVGTGLEPRSRHDKEIARKVLKGVADLGRLGGLLKLWLVDRPGVGASVDDVRRVLQSIDETRGLIHEFLRR